MRRGRHLLDLASLVAGIATSTLRLDAGRRDLLVEAACTAAIAGR